MRYRSGLLAIILVAVSPILLSLTSYASDTALNNDSTTPATNLAGDLLPVTAPWPEQDEALDGLTSDLESQDLTALAQSPSVSHQPAASPTVVSNPSLDAQEVTKVPQSAPEIINEPQVPAATSLLIGGFKTDGSGVNEYVLIYNPADIAVRLTSDWQLQALNQTGSSAAFKHVFSDQVIEARSSLVVRHNLLDGEQFVELLTSDMVFRKAAGDAHTEGRLYASGSIELLYQGVVHDEVGWNDVANYSHPLIDSGAAWSRCTLDGVVVDNGNNLADYWLLGDQVVSLTGLPTCLLGPETGSEDQEPPINQDDTTDKLVSSCNGVVISEIGANLDQQFVELYNPTNQEIDLTGCRLMTNRSKERQLDLSGVVIQSKSWQSFEVTGDNLLLTKTTSGEVYLIDSGDVELESVKYENLKSDTSWMRGDDNTWRQTYNPTPSFKNNYQQFPSCEVGYEFNQDTWRCNKLVLEPELKPCPAGQLRHPDTNRCRMTVAATSDLKPCAANQYRSLETNRCRNLSTETSSLTPCKLGQHRSPETNRCRSVAVVTTSLKPCAANQFRNPETNRCKLITSTSSGLKPCLENQERNPETNRCRKVASTDIPVAAYAVEPIESTAASRAAWWSLVGFGSIALGYAGWQWRYEVGSIVRRLIEFSRRGK